jgi:fructoselysine 6-kinase
VIVASVGDNCVDHYLGAATLELAGGNALNVAAGLSAAGLQSYYLGAVGEDANAELILDGARRANIVTTRIKRLHAPTGVTVVRLRDDGTAPAPATNPTPATSPSCARVTGCTAST